MMALNKIGAIAILASNQLQEHDFEYRYNSAGVKAIVCTADGDTYTYAESAAKKCPQVERLVMVGGAKEGWRDFDVEYQRFSAHYYRSENTSCGDDTALMFFTSGTTGTSKCVMLCQKNIFAAVRSAIQSVCFTPDDVLVSVLPVHHTYELMCTIAGSCYGMQFCACTSLRHVMKDFKEYRPTGLTLVPLFVTTMYKRIMSEAKNSGKDKMLGIAATAGRSAEEIAAARSNG